MKRANAVRTMQDAVVLYRSLGLSCYPTVFMEKRCMPGVSWKVFQQRAPTAGELGLWHYNYSQDNGGPGYGLAIPTGYGAGSVVPYAVDCDNGVPESLVQCNTTTVEHGGRGPCLVFSGPLGMGPGTLIVNLDGTEVELKGLGSSFTAPLSIYRDGTSCHCTAGKGWDQIKDLPSVLRQAQDEYATKPNLPRSLNAHGYDQRCLATMMDPKWTIVEGECYNTLWVAYWLLQREDDRGKGFNSGEAAQRTIRSRNAMLERPLPESRLRDIFNGRSLKYTPGCTAARSRLSWIARNNLCWRCQRMETHSALNVRKAQEAGLGPTEQAVIHFMTVTGVTSLSGIAAALNVKDPRTVKAAITRIVAAGCWPNNVDLPAKNAGDWDKPNVTYCDSTTGSSDR
jgi:hypothetical protein